MLLAVVAFPVLAVLTLWLLSRWTQLRNLPVYLSVPLFISFFIPLSIVALVPFDLVDDGTLDDRARLLMWRVIYWASFFLMWLILPLLQAYIESGFHAPLLRLKDALRSMLRYNLIVLTAGVAGAIYMGVSTGISFTNLKAVGVALSYTYGLMLVIYLLGHGLVEIPRSVWHFTKKQRLSKNYTRATGVHDSFCDAQSAYDDVVARILALEPVKTEKYAEWLDSTIAEIRQQDFPLGRASAARAQPRDLTSANLAQLCARFRRELSRNVRARAEWMRLLADVVDLESKEPGVPQLVLVRGLALVLAGFSAVITWSELMSGTRLSLVDLTIRHSPAGLRVLLAVTLLSYMSVCVMSSLTSLKVFNLYAIVPKHTDGSSLLFFAANALRLTVPLSYNFMMLNSTQHTVFQEFLGRYINLTPLGKSFNEVIPRLILLPMALALFSFYELMKDYLGFGLGMDYFEDTETGTLTVESEGRDLVRRALQSREFREIRSESDDESVLGRIRGFMSNIVNA